MTIHRINRYATEKLAVIGIIVFGTLLGTGSATGQEILGHSLSDLHAELDNALCINDWDRAVNTANTILTLPDLDEEYRESMISYRFDIIEWRESGQRLTFEGCGGVDWDAAIRYGASSRVSNPHRRTSTGGLTFGSGTSSGNCDFPWQIAADGSQCGGRAASER